MDPFEVRFKREKRAFRADPRKRRIFGAFSRFGCDIFAAGQAVTNPAFCADYRARQQSNHRATVYYYYYSAHTSKSGDPRWGLHEPMAIHAGLCKVQFYWEGTSWLESCFLRRLFCLNVEKEGSSKLWILLSEGRKALKASKKSEYFFPGGILEGRGLVKLFLVYCDNSTKWVTEAPMNQNAREREEALYYSKREERDREECGTAKGTLKRAKASFGCCYWETQSISWTSKTFYKKHIISMGPY